MTTLNLRKLVNLLVLQHQVSHTRAQSLKGGAVVFVHPLVSIFEKQADGGGGPVELVDLQPFHRFPVSSCG